MGADIVFDPHVVIAMVAIGAALFLLSIMTAISEGKRK